LRAVNVNTHHFLNRRDLTIVNALAQDFKGVMRQGFAWWKGELASLIPQTLRARFAVTAAPSLVVTVRDGELWLATSVRTSRIDRADYSEAITGAALIERLERSRKAGASPPVVRLRLPYRACLVRRIDVPERARADAGRILTLDFERATPFNAADVYAASYLDPVRNHPETLTFVQLIVKKSTIDEAVTRLEAMPATVDAVDCWSQDGATVLPVNFLDHAAGTSRGTPGSRTAKVLACVAALLAASAVWTSLVRHQYALSELEQQTADARARVSQIETQSGSSTAASKDRLSALKLKAERPAAVHILDELTRLLPDTAFLTEFSIDGDTVDISGFAPRAAALVPQLERSQVFSNVTLSAPVTFDGARDKERFSYRLQLRQSLHASETGGVPGADPNQPSEATP
jgi:general secretion pathway protein L